MWVLIETQNSHQLFGLIAYLEHFRSVFMKKRKWILFALFFLLGFWGFYHFYLLDFLFPYDKEFKEFVIKSAVPLRDIETQSDDYSGFKEIGAAIGEAKVVFLGEQDHGDAPTFITKTKIIKYLHENLDFDVLVFESDFYNLNRSLTQNDSVEFSTRSDYRDHIYSIMGQLYGM